MKKSSETLDWKIEFRPGASRSLKKLPRKMQERILEFLTTRIPSDPRRLGDALQGRLKGLWRYRVGDYRIICLLQNEIVTVVVVEIGHRRDIYEH